MAQQVQQAVEVRDEVIVGPVRNPRNSARHVKGSIHDDATASKLGFKGGTVAGSILLDLFPPLLLEAFGPRWFERGSVSMYFRNAITDNQPVQAFVRLPEGDAANAQVEGWVERREDDLRCAEGTVAAGDPGVPTALLGRDPATHEAGDLRMMAGLAPGDLIGEFRSTITTDQQAERLEVITDPLDWYQGRSPWGGPIVTPAGLVRAMHPQPADVVRTRTGGAVGLFGAIELRNVNGPMFVDQEYALTSTVVSTGETPKTEYLWFESALDDADGRRVVEMLMMLRFMKASSAHYREG